LPENLNVDPIIVVRRLVDAINRADWVALRSLLHPEFRRHSMAAGGSGEENAADFERFLRREHDTYPDAREEILDAFTDGTKVAARHLFTATQLGPLGDHPPTGKRVRSAYIALYHVEHGRIKEAWAEWDNLADLRQLGHVSGGA
jgi:predicted ester cyclase